MSGDLFGTDSGSTETVNKPWRPVRQPLANAFRDAKGVYRSAERLGNPLTEQASGVLSNIISGGYLNPSTNPFFRGAVDDALGQAKSAFAGQFGGQAGSNLGNSGYQEALARGLGSVATNAYSDAYNRERALQMGAVGAAPGFDQAELASRFAPLSQYTGLLTGATQGFGSQQQPYFQNNTANTLGTVAALGAIFSDERLKKDIEKVGEREDGIGVYEFRYLWENGTEKHVGALAQEVEKVKPEAVHNVGGVLAVNYGALNG